MPLELDYSNDYLLWDFTEAITLTRVSVVSGEDEWENVPIEYALRGQPAMKERAPTAGRYTGADLLWLIPAAILETDVDIPKPADVIVADAEPDTNWTILHRDYDQLDRVYQCYAVNLAIAEQLYERVTLWKPVNAQDATGSRLPTFYNHGPSIAARVQLESEEPTEERGKRLWVRKYSVYLEMEVVGVTHEWQLRRADGTILDVTGYRNRGRIDELPVVSCSSEGV